MRPCRLCPTILLSVLSSALVASDWYVAPSGSDANAGSLASPVRQIRQGLLLALPGDTIHVADGSYLGFTINGVTATAGAPLTIQAQGGHALVTVTTDRSDNRDTIEVSGCSYIVIDGLQAYNANRAGVRVDSSDHVTIEHGIFGGNTTWGIFTDFSNNLLIANNECYGSVQQHGCYVSNTCSNPVVRGNRLHDNASCGLHMNGDVSQGGLGLINNALVEDNLIYGNGALGGSGINCDGVVSSVIRDNLIYAEHGSGISLFQIDASGPSVNDAIIGNSIHIASDGRWALNIANLSTGTIICDNILLNDNPSHGSIQLDTSGDLVGMLSDDNLLCTGAIVASTDGNTTALGLTQWQALDMDAHALTAMVAAVFTNAIGGDYTLKAGSPAIGAGVGTFHGANIPSTDLLGHPRPGPQGYSLGAYEVPGGTTSGTGSTTSGVTAGSATSAGTTGAASTTGGATGTTVSSGGGSSGGGCGLGGGVGLLLGLLASRCRRQRARTEPR